MRRSKRRRPSRTRSQLVIPSRSARSAGVSPARRARPRHRPGARSGRPDRRMAWPGESSRCRRRRTSGASRSPRRGRGLLPVERPPTLRRRAGGTDGVLPPTTASDGCQVVLVVQLAHDDPRLDRFAAAHDAPGEVGRADVRGDLDVAADPDAARDDGALADDRDARCCSRPGSCSFGRSSIRSVADDGALADDDLLVEDRPVDDRAGPDDGVEHDDRVAHDGADVDPDARRQDRVDDRPGDDAAVADQALDGPARSGRPWPGRAPRTGCG